MVSHQIGSIFWLVFDKDLFLAHYYFSFTPSTLDVLSACLLAIQVCISLWTFPFNQPDLQTISDWAAVWLVTFNPQKILSMIISRKRNPVFHRPLFMNGTMIKNTWVLLFLILVVGMNMSNISQKNSCQG